MFYQTLTTRRPPKGLKNAGFCPWWPWPSNSSHVFCVNSAQIRSAVPEIFHSQTKTTDWRHQEQNLLQFTACGNNTLKQCNFTRIKIL